MYICSAIVVKEKNTFLFRETTAQTPKGFNLQQADQDPIVLESF